jgi:hypothetical protein
MYSRGPLILPGLTVAGTVADADARVRSGPIGALGACAASNEQQSGTGCQDALHSASHNHLLQSAKGAIAHVLARAAKLRLSLALPFLT